MEENLTKINYPMIALRGKVIFPYTFVGFDVGRSMSLKAVDKAMAEDSLIFIASQKNALIDNPKKTDVYKIGVVAKIKHLIKLPSNNVKVTVEALYRAKIVEYTTIKDVFTVNVERFDTVLSDEAETEAYFRIAKASFLEYSLFDKRVTKETFIKLSEIEAAEEFVNNVMSIIAFKDSESQKILEAESVVEKLKLFDKLIKSELEIAKIERKISSKVRQSIDKNQKEFYLREQLKAIHSELGDDVDEKQALKQEILDKKLPKEIEEKALKEIKRLEKVNPASPDYSLILNYLDWIKELPFNVFTEDTENLKDARAVLDADHFGLTKVKERIVEYLAVLQLTKSLKGPILCFVGPPGVGKTSIAMSIARALNRKFVRMSLGGVRDEAEIRGHRRTYVGSMPGRIIFGLKNAGSQNPVFLLDEIDKLSSDIQGDPASALLEVLDPEQNATFRDRFMEIPFDLSKVMFITTANSLDTIPRPLLDRMEVIEISGYTEEEKLEIAKRYLTPKQIKANGLTEENIAIDDGGLLSIIENYTMESGVRNLEREIGSVCRKVATLLAENPKTKKQIVTKDNIENYLGIKKFIKEKALETDEIGAATGLAWTSFGGTTLTIEVSLMKGKGEILLTGKLGDVMKESARAAISYIRSHAQEYDIKDDVFESTDIHIHVPEGATPKDGPSAGITMATAILSALTKRSVKKSVAMTGEITLRGKVLAIGGLKEKALAAHRLGIYDIIIPKENEKDLEDIPKEIRERINFIPCSVVSEVFLNALNK